MPLGEIQSECSIPGSDDNEAREGSSATRERARTTNRTRHPIDGQHRTYMTGVKTMSRSIRRVLKVIVKTSFAAALALTVPGVAVASADSLTVQQRAEAEMNAGKDYSAAWQAAIRAATVGVYPQESLIAHAKKVESRMNHGMDYFAASATPSAATESIHSTQQAAKANDMENRKQIR
jgi:hypothetical protein